MAAPQPETVSRGFVFGRFMYGRRFDNQGEKGGCHDVQTFFKVDKNGSSTFRYGMGGREEVLEDP
jgi:hypothetical protein